MDDELRGDVESFKKDVSQFSLIDSQIKEAESKIKPYRERIVELKKEKTELKTEICIYMDSNEIGECNYQIMDLLYSKKEKQLYLLIKSLFGKILTVSFV